MIKAGTVKQRKDRVETVTGESLSGALLCLPGKVRGKAGAKVELLSAHWEINVTETEVSQGRAAFSWLGSEKTGGPGGRTGGEPRLSCHCPLLPWL